MCRFLNPVSMFTGAAVVASVFIGSVWAGENKAIIKQFKKENPALFVFLVMLVSYFLMSLFGGVMVLLLGIKLPLLCKFLKKHYHNSKNERRKKEPVFIRWKSCGWNTLWLFVACRKTNAKQQFIKSRYYLTCNVKFKVLCYFAFQWSLHMHHFAYGTWKTNWRIRWRALESRNHPWESYLKHWVNKKRTSIKCKTFWRANSRSELLLSFSLEWRNGFQLARFQKTTPFIPTSLIGKAKSIFQFFSIFFFYYGMK